MKYYFFSLIIFLNVIAVTAAVAQGPTSENVVELLQDAALLSQLERYEEALPYFDRVLEIEPENVDALKGKGIVLVFMERYEEASLILDRAIELAPEDRDALRFKMTALGALGKSREAGEYLLRISIIEEKVNSFVESGIEHYDKKELDESLSYFESALELDPKNVNALNGKAVILSERGKWLEAVSVIQKAEELAPSNQVVRKNFIVIIFNGPGYHHPDGSLKILVRDANGGLIGYQELLGFRIFQTNVTDIFLDNFEVKKVIQREGQDHEVSQILIEEPIDQRSTFFQTHIITQVKNTKVPSSFTLNHAMPLQKGDVLSELWTIVKPVG